MDGNGSPLYDVPEFPGVGLPPRAEALETPLQAWARLCKGQTIGHKANLFYDASIDDAIQLAGNDCLEIGGEDIDATQLQITLCPPAAIPREAADLDLNFQHQTGELDNANVGAANYPGDVTPIAWPPITARIEYGTGGTRAVVYADFVNGTSVNITASWVRVTAVVMPDAIHAPGTTGLYTLAAFASPGWPRNGNAQRTIYVGTIPEANDESAIFPVPPFAKKGTVIGCDTGSPPAVTVAYIQFWQSPDGTKNVGNYLVNGNQPIEFNVPNGGAYFSIVSAMSSPTLFAALFDLAV